MTFAAPLLLATLLLVPIALAGYLLVQRRRTRYAVRFTNVDLLANLAPRTPGWRRHLPTALYLAAIAALAIALARPSMTIAVPRNEATVVLAMDTSRSMLATDVEPDRLAAAQAAATTFVNQLPDGFRVGLVAFSTEARLVVEPTTDHARVLDAIGALRADGGTALGDAIALSLQAAGVQPSTSSGAGPTTGGGPASPAPSPATSPTPGASVAPDASPGASTDGSGDAPLVATVLLSDGANSTGQLEPLDAASQAAADGVPVYTIALGTADGVVDVPNNFGQLVPLSVPPDAETLAAIAETTGARAFQAPTADDLASIYQSLGSKVGYTQEQQEVTQWFAAGALLLVVIGGGLAAVWFNRFP
jgi:Ca-activated chloride channel family protein